MRLEFDQVKDSANRRKHGLSLGEFGGFDLEPIEIADERRDYGEQRYRAIGKIDGKLHMIAYVRRDDVVRLISFKNAAQGATLV
ncbi:MAG: BrnT family toxin [Sphingomonadaceae bacterium]|nr:BrnT family toxin [Sphingomonadaceae bacterium]